MSSYERVTEVSLSVEPGADSATDRIGAPKIVVKVVFHHVVGARKAAASVLAKDGGVSNSAHGANYYSHDLVAYYSAIVVLRMINRSVFAAKATYEVTGTCYGLTIMTYDAMNM